jgi:hypothetical protein
MSALAKAAWRRCPCVCCLSTLHHTRLLLCSASQCALYLWASPPGKMIVVDEEAVQVLQVTAGGAKKAAKLLVKRACMGTRPTAHSFHAPVLAMPHIVSYRPGLFCIGFVGVLEGKKRSRSCSFGRHNHTDRSNVVGRAGTSPAPMILSTASLEDIVGACKREKDILIRIPSAGVEGDTEGGKAEGEKETGVSGGPARITEWFKACRQDLRWLNFARAYLSISCKQRILQNVAVPA